MDEIERILHIFPNTKQNVYNRSNWIKRRDADKPIRPELVEKMKEKYKNGVPVSEIEALVDELMGGKDR